MFTTRPELAGRFGMVSSTHWLASQSGMAVLEAGGNAFDATVAAGLVLQVVEPHMAGPGGEVPIVAWSVREGRPFVVCGQGVAPRAATVDAFVGEGLALVPGTGLLPACVPGAFGAWMLLLRDHGTMRLRDVLRYAIEYAGGGFPLPNRAADAIAGARDHFVANWPTSRDAWLPSGNVPEPLAIFRNPDLAGTYERLVAEAERSSNDRDEQIEAARRGFYEGFVAEAIATYAATAVMDVTGDPHRGLLGYDDLHGWRATVEEPLSFDYHGHTVLKPGPWSQGPVFLQQLAILAGFDLGRMGTVDAEFVHVVAEGAKLAFADREAYYGDPAYVDVPLGALLSAGYADDRRVAITDAAVVDGLHPGRPDGRTPQLPMAPAAGLVEPGDVAVGEPTLRRRRGLVSGDTCHVDVADRFGNLVAATPSGGWLQSSPVVPGLGFPLTTRGQMFWLDPAHPNALAPGKRPRTTLTPSLVLRGGSPYLAFGTPGGDFQDQWSLLFFLRHIHHGCNLQEAIDAPNWHTTHAPSSFYPRQAHPGELHVEARLPADTLADLRRRGHRVQVEDAWSLGRLCAVSRDAGGTLRAAANPRGMQGYAVGR